MKEIFSSIQKIECHRKKIRESGRAWTGRYRMSGLFVEISSGTGRGLRIFRRMFTENCSCESRDRRVRSNETGLRARGLRERRIRGGDRGGRGSRPRTSRRACSRWVTSSVSISPRHSPRKPVRAGGASGRPATARRRCGIGKRYVFARDSRYRRCNARRADAHSCDYPGVLSFKTPARSRGALETA